MFLSNANAACCSQIPNFSLEVDYYRVILVATSLVARWAVTCMGIYWPQEQGGGGGKRGNSSFLFFLALRAHSRTPCSRAVEWSKKKTKQKNDKKVTKTEKKRITSVDRLNVPLSWELTGSQRLVCCLLCKDPLHDALLSNGSCFVCFLSWLLELIKRTNLEACHWLLMN